MAFIFSHTGASPGNELADKLATAAMKRIGSRWTDGIWHKDSTRRILRDLHDAEHHRIEQEIGNGKCSVFRFAHAMRSGRGFHEPSQPLPRAMTRASEMILYRARVGTMPHLGGFFHGVIDNCPFCDQPKLARGGKTIEHLLECVTYHVTPPARLAAAELWTNPTAAAEHLWMIQRAAAVTNVGRSRAEWLVRAAVRHQVRTTRRPRTDEPGFGGATSGRSRHHRRPRESSALCAL